jgi:hypothetical protein
MTPGVATVYCLPVSWTTVAGGTAVHMSIDFAVLDCDAAVDAPLDASAATAAAVLAFAAEDSVLDLLPEPQAHSAPVRTMASAADDNWAFTGGSSSELVGWSASVSTPQLRNVPVIR